MKNLLFTYFSFKGRLNRWRYFLLSLPLGGLMLIAFVYITIKLNSNTVTNTAAYIYLAMYILLIIILSISGISLTVRRLHDLDKTGWFVLIQFLNFIPVLSLFALAFNLYVMFFPGTDGPNPYGEDPLLVDTLLYNTHNE